MTWEQQRVSFGANATTYDSIRPDWPAATAAWLTGAEPGSGREGVALDVVDLGAGTGKLTSTLASSGHRVTAVEPDEGMLAVLAGKLPQVRAVQGSAEQIPLPDHSVDVVTVAQAWHWMKQPAAALEIARVLRPGGLLAVAWHNRDVTVPWVAELNQVAGVPRWSAEINARADSTGSAANRGHADSADGPVHSGDAVVGLPSQLYGPVADVVFDYTLVLPTAALPQLASSWSYVAGRPDRDEVLEQVRRLAERVAAEQGDHQTLRVPHKTYCHRARTVTG
ncbi:class I SAM-dependent methyltransferase [Kineosporia mesophila]|uniref:Class I SAM-dependent methyltransferase n=1 Tax=Kineosporia mesophila TaxID=566012 RepID=A0ABP6ZDV8_9ACTN|nr:class I SAM-dependent methyltransferase [Kineosporia mesophila]MCD5350381.1 class I SAM-dependent methyltransferase [Kineosporia mesophila]